MIIIVLFALIPFLFGLIVEYLVCRLLRKRGWRLLPPIIGAAAAALIAAGRIRVWSSQEISPITQLIFFPGISAVFLLFGLWVGWRLWHWWWNPKVIRDQGKK